MLLGLNHIDPKRIAFLDSEGGRVTYGDIIARAEQIRTEVPERTFCILPVENTAADALEVIAMIASERLVPLIVNRKTDATLMAHLNETYGQTNHAIHPKLSHLLPTSGSTGSPKLVRHCYDNIEAAGLNISTFFELKETDRPLMVLPLYYTMGLSMLFSHLRVGATILITNRNMTDAVFWKFMKDEHATSFTGVPYSYQILNLMRVFRMDLPDLELLTQGGGKMPHDLNVKFAEYCRDHNKRWIATYGQSECTARMAYLPAKWALDKVGSIGIAEPGGHLSLVNNDNVETFEGEDTGEMVYRGENVTLGYANSRDDLLLGDENHGVMHTGDLARRDADGCYYIIGRLKRFLKIFGLRIGLDELENIIRTNYDTDCYCSGTDEKLIVKVTNPAIADSIPTLIEDKTHLFHQRVEMLVVDKILRNETGKVINQ